jgi:RNA polymerase sigma-70 factor (ECF subfamily)
MMAAAMTLEEAYDRYASRLYHHALALTRRGADAEDAVQAAFVKVASRLRARAAIEDMETYLHAAVRGEALRIVGRRGPSNPGTPLVAPVNGASLEDAEAVAAALAALPPEQREVVVLHVYEEMTFRRIGEVLGIPLDTAASRYRYAREKLKELLGED